ncbi:gamma-tubulin complex component GCP4 [Blumeria hordei DH14]|uniref:Spindle pole body component n=1 Tax=Blumeria graminis f. sp. hordei (strain DH14) TaxID=546991 RepID=N1J5K4_BLUG1|nr:gamma-tubulin complex component GCP4 [Blumeria hordei DH14]
MLHEILLSLSGHPSPLLTSDDASSSIFSPPEKALLSSIAHLSELHCKLLSHTSTIAATHPSGICQAVANTLRCNDLAKFQQRILDVEHDLLRHGDEDDGSYKKVPLTSIVGQFSGWTRRMEWFLEILEFIMREKVSSQRCSGAMLIDHLCDSLQTGYLDIEEAALSLITVAETAWLKQVSAWVLYGRLPSFGRDDFFIQTTNNHECESKKELLPAFVSAATANSLLFIGRSLNHIKVKELRAKSLELNLLHNHLQQMSSLQFPITSANFSRVISSIRSSLSQITLRSLLPLSKVIGILSLLREIFLLGRGEFATALVTEADLRMHSRWQYCGISSFEDPDASTKIYAKEGEVSAILARTWASLSAMRGQHEENQEEDDILELARDLVQLTISRPTVTGIPENHSQDISETISSTPFNTLLLSIPTTLTLEIPSPLDLFLTPSDIQIYSIINAYLLSISRAHLRLTSLWKVSAIRRDQSSPWSSSMKMNQAIIHARRLRSNQRLLAMRKVWATSSAALFFLAETEAYFQAEVVQGIWFGFKNWINAESGSSTSTLPTSRTVELDCGKNIWLQTEADGASIPPKSNSSMHDPQSLADAHRRYLSALTANLLLEIPTFTQPLYHLCQQVDHLVSLVHQIHSIWQSLDLETDEGVVDAFSDFCKEEKLIKEQLTIVAARVKTAIENLIGSLREIDQNKFVNDSDITEFVLSEDGQYIPSKVGRVDRLLMKLDFGGWFDDCGKENHKTEKIK